MACYLLKNGDGDIKFTKSRADMAALTAAGYRVIEMYWS